jgi:hypothetical protein
MYENKTQTGVRRRPPMSASGGEAGGDSNDHRLNGGPEEPPERKHGTRLQWCMSEEGEERLVVYQPEHDDRWVDAASDIVSELEEMR